MTMKEQLNLYKKALTRSVSLPKGVLPDGDDYYTWMWEGNVLIEKSKEGRDKFSFKK